MSQCDECKKVIDENEPCVEYFKGSTIIKIICNICDFNLRLKEYEKTNKLTTKLVNDAVIRRNYIDSYSYILQPILKDIDDIEPVIQEFGTITWKHIVECSDAELQYKGMSCEISEDVKMMTWTMCGRIMVTINDKENSITVMGNDNLNSWIGCSFRGIDATADKAKHLIRLAIDAFKAGKLNLIADGEVRYL